MNYKAKLISEIKAITWQDLVWNKATKTHDWVERPIDVLTVDEILTVTSEDGSSLIDYYGEFRGGYPYIDPRLEAIAEKHGYYWEWNNPGSIGLYLQ